MNILFLAWRNLARQKRRSFLLGGAVAFGILILTVINGCAGGLAHGFEQNVSSIAVGHVFYSVAERETQDSRLRLSIQDDSLILQAVAEAGVEAKHIVRRTEPVSTVSIIYQGESVIRGMKGIKWNEDPLLVESLNVTQGSLEGLAGTDGLVVSDSVAKRLQVDIGDRVLVQTLTVNGQVNVVELEVRAVYQAGYFAFSVYMDVDLMNRLLDLPEGSYNLLGIFLEDINQSRSAVKKIDAAFRRLDPEAHLASVEHFQERGFQRAYEEIRRDNDFTVGQRHMLISLQDEPMLKSFLVVLEAIQAGASVVVLFLLGIVMVGIINTYRIIIQERRREIGTMRALGMRKNKVVALFVYEAMILVIIGATAGFLLGILLLFILGLGEHMFFLGDRPEFAFFLVRNHLAWRLNGALMTVTLVVVAVFTYIAAWIPARKAGKMHPAAALRL